ncbi:MAG: ATP-binding protein [Chryseobacterium sp.]|nr:MAG: ATP-binding protein [Chryseobacterium sp.]
MLILFCFACSEKENSRKNVSKKSTNPFYEKAFVLQDKNELDSAFFYLNKAKDIFSKKNDSLGVAKSLVNMAFIQENIGDNFGSIETSLEATKFLKEKDTAQHTFIFCNYNTLGINSSSLKNYDDAYRFYKKAQPFTKDPIDRMMLANNLAILFHNQKEYGKSLAVYEQLLDSVGSKSEYYPKLLLNYSRSKWFFDKDFNPSKDYLLAEKLSQNFEDDWTKDAAYAYLSAYYLKNNTDSAGLYARKMLSLANKLQYPTDQLEALQTLIKISDGAEAHHYFDQYSRIQDSLTTAQNKAKNQFALIRFESEKAKTENLKLQKEHEVHQFQVAKQKFINWILVFVFIIVIVTSYIWIKKRRERFILESKNRLQKQRLDFSKKVHDVVANGIYEVISAIENQSDIPKEKVLDKLELMYEKSRDLSYENPLQQDFNEQMSALISSFDNTETKIIIIGNDYDFWKLMTQNQKEELFNVIRELLINMKKHSRASQVILRFIKEENNYEIKYIDNGIGLPKNYTPKNGLTNILTRLSDIGANLIFEDNPSGGVRLSIKL